MSHFSGPATVVELVPEGTVVTTGTVLVRFDDSRICRELSKLEADEALAQADLDELVKVKIPLELHDLAAELREAEARAEAERGYCAGMRELLREGLATKEQVAEQDAKANELDEAIKSIRLKQDLIRSVSHPSAIKRAEATLASVKRSLTFTTDQLAQCTLRAPVGGMVMYSPLHLSGEFRAVRVGDLVYQNQPFMLISDMAQLVVNCMVTELELARLREGAETTIVPLALPSVCLKGRVARIASMARSPRGRAATWQKCFPMTVVLDENDPALRIGMTVHVHIRTYHAPKALLVPRVAVSRQEGRPTCRVLRGPTTETRIVRLGQADEMNYEVLEGLSVDEAVLLE